MSARGVRRHIGRAWFHTTFCVLLLAGCGTEPPPERPVSSIHEPQGTSLLIQVLDTSNKPIPSALVTSFGGTMRPTDGAGYILYENLVPGRFSARVEKWGYAPASVFVELPEGAHGGTDVRLIPLPPRIAFDAAAGAALDQGPVHVTIPSNAIIDANGEPFTGTAEATIVPLDPTTDLANAPGPLQGVQTDGSEVGLESLFMADITLWNGAQQLQLAPGKVATLEMVLPDSIASNVQMGQSISAWSFDLDAGIWREEGAGTVGASIAEPGKTSWVAQVSHFTWWNSDAPWTEKHCFRVQLLDSDGSGVPNISVGAEGIDYQGSSMPKVTSTPGGYACLDIKQNGTASIWAGNATMPLVSTMVTGSGAAASCGRQGAACMDVSMLVPSNSICIPGTQESCPYAGPSGTEGVGNCVAGTKWCNATGTAWTNCVGEVLPQPEDCNSAADEDCDGLVNEEGDNCACKPMETSSCYTGRTGTLGVGICAPGQRACVNGFFGGCTGEITPQVESCATPDVDDNCDGTTDCQGVAQWSKAFGDNDNEGADAVGIDSDGNIVMAGFFEGTLSFAGTTLTSAGDWDIFVAKFDPYGEFLWSKSFGTPSIQRATGLGIDESGNIVVVGRFDGAVDFGGGPLVSAGSFDLFATKLDPGGNHLWSKRFGGTGEENYMRTAIDGAGNVLVAASFVDTVDLGGGPLQSPSGYAAFVAKLDPNGNHIWSKSSGSTGDPYPAAIRADQTGNVIISGAFQGTVDFGGDPLQAVGSPDIFLAKLDPSGNHLWSKRFGGFAYHVAQAGATDNANNILIAGSFEGTVDFGGGALQSADGEDVFVAKLDANGNHLWSRRFGGLDRQIAFATAADSKNDVTLAGYHYGSIDFGGGSFLSKGAPDMFVAKLDSQGNHLWSKSFGSSYYDSAQDAAIDEIGNIVLAGYVGGPVDFGTGPVMYGGGFDVLVAKFTP